MKPRKLKLSLCYTVIILGLLSYSVPPAKESALGVCNLFSDHMVLQQRALVNFWGKATPGQQVAVLASWKKNSSATADSNGKWKLQLATPAAGGPYTIEIKTSDSTIKIKDVLIGEVWLASGQSNMDLPLGGWPPNDTVFNATQEISQANYPEIRWLKVPFNISANPIDSIGGTWNPESPETVGNFSAAAYFFAKKLYQELHVPIGIIQSSIGGTPVEAWTSRGYLEKMGDFNKQIAGLNTLASTTAAWFMKWPKQPIPTTDKQWETINFMDIAAPQTAFDDKQWKEIKLPGRFDTLSSGEFDGAMWFRKEFNIDDTTTDYALSIGGIDDMDATYINGKKVGGLVGKLAPNAPRKMAISKSLLRKGRNIIAIRAIDTGGPGSISGMMSISNGEGVTIPLEGYWKKRLVAEIQKGEFYDYGLQSDLSKRPDLFQFNSNTPTALFNAMINPLVPYTIKGVIWYQGESNVGRAEQYKRLFPNMIEDWRNKWGRILPFYFVQIAPYNYTDPLQKGQSQKLRNAQRYGLKLPKTGMVSTLDIGRLSSAHPTHKREVGDRLARFALANQYGKNIIPSGPIYKSMKVSGSQAVVSFEFVGTGLEAGDKGLYGFEIAGADKIFNNGNAKIVNNKVEVFSPFVKNPVYVRYAWSDSSTASLFNKEGLPAATFTSEN